MTSGEPIQQGAGGQPPELTDPLAEAGGYTEDGPWHVILARGCPRCNEIYAIAGVEFGDSFQYGDALSELGHRFEDPGCPHCGAPEGDAD